jgi:hypothetical protein
MGKPTTRSTQVNSVEREGQVGAVQLKCTRVICQAVKDLKLSMLDPFVEHPVAGSIPHECFHSVAALVEENEQVPWLRVFIDDVDHHATESVKALAHVNWFATDEDAYRWRWRETQPPASVPIIRRSCCSLSLAGMVSRCPLESASSMGSPRSTGRSTTCTWIRPCRLVLGTRLLRDFKAL